MSKQRKSSDNVVTMPARGRQRRTAARELNTVIGADDARTREALRLVGAFLAIEDEEARRALIALAERLISYDWLRKPQQR